MTNTPRFLLKDENGNIGYSWQPDASSGVKGVVRVDGTTIISNNGVLSAGAGIALPIGALIQSLLPLSDAAYLLLDGALIQGEGSYAGFYNYLENLYSNNPNAAYFCTEAQWQASVNTYGSCGKFVIDTVNKTIRLPKVSDILQGTTDLTALGTLIEAGLPSHTHTRGTMEITGRLSASHTDVAWTGAFAKEYDVDNWDGIQKPAYGGAVGNFAASRSWTGTTSAANYSSSLADKNTVQPQTIQCLTYIAAATAVKTDIQVNIDNIVSDLEGRADRDLSNITDSAKVLMSGMGMPSAKYINLTLGASGSIYTAPADGWFVFAKTANSSSVSDDKYVSLHSSRGIVFDCNGAWQFLLTAYAPVKKGDSVTAYYNASGKTSVFKFIYAAGSAV